VFAWYDPPFFKMERSLRELVKEKIVVYDTRIKSLISCIKTALTHSSILFTSIDHNILKFTSSILPRLEKILDTTNRLGKIIQFILYVVLAILILVFIKLLGSMVFSP